MSRNSTDSTPDSAKIPSSEREELVAGELRSQIESVVRDSKLTTSIVKSIIPMTPDASLRRYFRVHFSDSSSVVVMKFDSVACPEAGGGIVVNSDLAYVELSRFFSAHHVAVPELLYDARGVGLLLIEDLGDTQLIHLLADKSAPHEQLFTQALQQIARIQSIPPQPGFFPFERFFSSELYIREMNEFRDFILVPNGTAAATLAIVEALFADLAEELDGFDRVLVHRDFHGWNLLVDQSGQVRVIDFQDALCATRAYDLVSLLNDRDMDSALGERLYCSLVTAFSVQSAAGSAAERERFLREYDRVLLQRDLKVAGRFAKLVATRGLMGYGAWIPGTLRRIGRTLERLSSEQARYRPALELLSTLLPPIKEGAASPLRFE